MSNSPVEKDERLRVLFISRAYPPVVGGIENHNETIGRWLSTVVSCEIIANRKGRKWLPFFIPWAVGKSMLSARRADVVLLGDGVVAFVGWCLKLVYPNKRIVGILCGLDITYSSRLYQKFWVGGFFSAVDHFVAISHSTADTAVAYGINKKRVSVIPCGVEVPEQTKPVSRSKISGLVGSDLSEKKIILTVGRLVKRKGVVWFVKNVMPALPKDIVYIVAGDGPEKAELQSVVQSSEYLGRVFYVGAIDDTEKKMLYSSSDLFIQPNIPVSGDVEGFGITVLEAGSYGLPVIASDLEGLKDSVQEGANGWRVPAKDVAAYVDKIVGTINRLHDNPDLSKRITGYVKDRFSCAVVIEQYRKVLGKAC